MILACILLVYSVVNSTSFGSVNDKKPGGCLTIFGRFGKVGYYVAVAPVKHVGKSLFYPAVIGAKAVPHIRDAIRGNPKGAAQNLGSDIWGDKWHVGFYAIAAALYRSSGISLNQYIQATGDFDDAAPGELTVIVDAFDDDDILYGGGGTYLYSAMFKNNPNIVLINHVKSWGEVFEKLEEVVRTRGRIKKLDFYAHGLPGASFGGENAETILGLIDRPERELFQKDAYIRFVSCFIDNGSGGDKFFETFHKYFTPRGAKVWASKVQIVPNLIELAAFKLETPEPPKLLRNLGEPLSVGLGIWTVASMLQVGHYQKSSGETMEGPFLFERTAKRTIPAYERQADVPEGQRAEFMQDIYEARARQFQFVVRNYGYLRDYQEYYRKSDPVGSRDPRMMDRFLTSKIEDNIQRYEGDWFKLGLASPIDMTYFRFLRETPGITELNGRLLREARQWITAEHVKSPDAGLSWLAKAVATAKGEIDDEYSLALNELQKRHSAGYLSDKRLVEEKIASARARNFFKARIDDLGKLGEKQIVGP